MKLPYFIVLVTIVYVTSAFRSELHSIDHNYQQFELNELVPLENVLCYGKQCEHHRQRRWLGALVKIAKVAWTGAKITLKYSNHVLSVASVAYTVINLASEGCATYPRICENKDELKALEEECRMLSEQLLKKYGNSQEDYNILREVVLNNIKMDNILEGIAEEVDQVFNMSVEVDNILSKDISNATLLKDLTPQEMLVKLGVPVEFRLQQIKKSIRDLKKDGAKSLGISIATILGVVTLKSGIKNFYNMYQKTAPSASFKQRLQLTFKAYKTNSKNFFGNFRQNVKTAITNKMNSLKAKVTNPKGTVKSYVSGITAVNTFFNALGVAASSFMIFISHKQWKEVDEKVQTSLENYRRYKHDLQQQLELANKQTEDIYDVKMEAIETFNNILTTLANGINLTAYQNTELLSSLESDFLPENVAVLLSNEKATENNVLNKQNVIVGILKDSKFQLEGYYGWVKALNLVAQLASEGVNKDQPVSEILEKIIVAFQYQDNTTKQFQSLVTLQSLVCVSSMILPELSTYRTYPLASIREDCSQGIPSHFSTSYVNEHKIISQEFIVRNEVLRQKAAKTDTNVDICSRNWQPLRCMESVEEIFQKLNHFFSNDPLLKTMSSPSRKDVIKTITALFPSDATFAFFDLTLFRDKSDVTEEMFQDLIFDSDDKQLECEKEERRKRRTLCRQRG